MAFTSAVVGGTGFLATAVEYNPGATPITAPAAAPTATGSASGGTLPAATYTYQVTFVGGTPAGETTPSPATTGYVATGTTSSVALSAIPTGGTGTTARKIYRSTGSGYFYLTTISDNTTTTYTDTGSVTLGTAQPPSANSTNIGTPGTALAPTNYVPVMDKGLKAPWDLVKPEVMRGTRMTMAVAERAKIQPQGPIDWALNPSLGVEFFLASLGASASLSLVTGTTTVANTTANGVTSLTVAGSFVPGAIVLIGTGASQEARTVISYAAGVLKVGQCVTNATAASGITVTQPAQTKYANSLLPAAAANLLPTLTLEDVHGKNQWSWQFPGMYVEKLDVDFAKDQHKVQATMFGISAPNFFNAGNTAPATGTTATYSPNATDEANALRPLTSIDAYAVAFGDPDATGSSTVRAALGITDVKVALDNALIKEPAYNNSTAYLVFPGDKAKVEITYNEIMTSARPAVWYDAIQASVASAFTIAAIKNYGTSLSPDWGGVSFYVPAQKFETDDVTTKIGQVDKAAKKATALATPGVNDYLQIFVLKP